MQDRDTGAMHLIGEDEAKEHQRMNDKLEEALGAYEGDIDRPRKKVPLFRKGEVVEVKGGRFRIIRLTPLGMILKGVPDTTPLG